MGIWHLTRNDIFRRSMEHSYWPASRGRSEYTTDGSGALVDTNFGLGDRALMLGGQGSPGNTNVIDFIQTKSGGTASDFGDLTRTTAEAVTNNDWTIATTNSGNVIDFITMSTTGNAVDFGDDRNSVGNGGNWSSHVRGFSGIGTETPDISSFMFSSKGNAEEWSDLSTAGTRNHSGSSSNTRAVITGTFSGSDPGTNDMLDFSLTHQGVVASFGDLTAVKTYCGGASSGTRGLAAGGNVHPSNSLGTIDTFMISTRANGTDFGDLTSTRSGNAGVGDGVNAVFMGGHTRISGSNTVRTTIDKTTFASTGSCSDFGDLTVARQYPDAAGQAAGHLHDYLAHGFTKYYTIPDYQAGNMVIHGPGDSRHQTIEYHNMMTLGNSVNFGDTTASIKRLCGVGSNAIKAAMLGGYDVPGSTSNTIETVYFQSKGNTADWGTLSTSNPHSRGTGNSTRCLRHDATAPAGVTVDFITWASIGNAADFGDTSASRGQCGAASSTTRAIFAGGATGPTELNSIDYFTIASTGDATDFGDLTQVQSNAQGDSSLTRAVFAGGYGPGDAVQNVIQYVTIASTGDAADFGDLTVARADQAGAGNTIRCGWYSGGGDNRVMDYVTIATTGNAADFGDMADSGRNHSSGCNGHGGL